MAIELPTQESRRLHRVPGLPNIEFLSVDNSRSTLRWFNTEYAIGMPSSWRGEITYRGKRQLFTSGMSLCVAPGEIHELSRVHRAGSFRVVSFEPAAFAGYLEEHGISINRLDWNQAISTLSDGLSCTVRQVLWPGQAVLGNSLELQCRIVTLFEGLASELVYCPSRRPVRNPGVEVAERIRERLHSGEEAGLDLETLAREQGVSRFQALRSFKRRFGLPPHAYLMTVKISYARELLRDGHRLADVAATCGFSDQSHFGRHFKRTMGVTPATYARMYGHPAGPGEQTRAALHGPGRLAITF